MEIDKNYIEGKMATLPNGLGKSSNRVQNEWITSKEEKFGIVLPDEYKWFVQHYDFIVLCGEIKNGIASDEVYFCESPDDEYSLYAPTFFSFLEKEISHYYS